MLLARSPELLAATAMPSIVASITVGCLALAGLLISEAVYAVHIQKRPDSDYLLQAVLAITLAIIAITLQLFIPWV